MTPYGGICLIGLDASSALLRRGRKECTATTSGRPQRSAAAAGVPSARSATSFAFGHCAGLGGAARAAEAVVAGHLSGTSCKNI